MAKKKKIDDIHIFQLKVTLADIKPLFWRQIQVKSNTTLHKLHLIIQEIMGWENYHLQHFTINGKKYSEPQPTDMFEVNDERKVTLSQYVLSVKS